MYRVLLYVLVASLILCQSAGAQIGFPGGGGGASTSAANTWTGVQTFGDAKLRLSDSAGDHFITIESNTNEAANYSLIVPDLSASDTIMTLSATQQTVTGLKYFDSGTFAILDAGDDHSYNIQMSGNDSANRVLTLPVLTGNRTFAFIDEAQTISANHTYGNTNLLINDAGNDEPVSIRPAEQSNSGNVLVIPDIGSGTATLVTTASTNTYSGINTFGGSGQLKLNDAGGDEPVGITLTEQTGTGGVANIPDLATATKTFQFIDLAQTISANHTFGNTNLLINDASGNEPVTIAPAEQTGAGTLVVPDLAGGSGTVFLSNVHNQIITGATYFRANHIVDSGSFTFNGGDCIISGAANLDVTGSAIFDSDALTINDPGGDEPVTISPLEQTGAGGILVIPDLAGASVTMATTGANTWAANQTFGDTFLRLDEAGAGTDTVTISAAAQGDSQTLTIPNLNGGGKTLALLELAQTFTQNCTFNSTLTAGSTFNLKDTGGDHNVTLAPAGNEAGNRTLNIPLMGGTGCLLATLNVQSTDVNTAADTTETDAFSYTLPANVLGATGRVVKYTVHGSTGATADTKTVKLYFGGTEVYTTGAVTANNKDWKLTLTIIDTGTNTQDVFIDGVFNATPVAASTTQTKTDSSTNVIKTTLTNGAATANDITAKGSICTVQ